MNVIIIDEESRYNGIGTYIRELISIFTSLNAQISWVCYDDTVRRFTIGDEGGVRKYIFPAYVRANYPKLVDKMLSLYLEDSEENLFMLNYCPCSELLSRLKGRFPRSRFTYTIHDMMWTYQLLGDTGRFRELLPRIQSDDPTPEIVALRKGFQEEMAIFNMVDKVIVLAQETYDLLLDAYHLLPEKLFFVPNGLADNAVQASAAEKRRIKWEKYIGEEEKILLIAGRVHYIKGIYPLLKSFREVLRTEPDCRLVVAGPMADARRTLECARDIAAKVIFTGQLSKEELQTWYKIADIGLLVSYVEQCSYSGIEMMMNGLPVVASDGFCVKEMFRDGINAKVAEIGSRTDDSAFCRDLCAAQLALLQSAELRRKLGAKGRQRYEQEYTIEEMRRGYGKL